MLLQVYINSLEVAVTALLQMDEMTQQNASLVEQAAAASEAMGAQAEELTASVENFKLSENEAEYKASIKKRPIQKLEQTNSEKLTQQHNPKAVLPITHEDSADEDNWQEF